LAVSQARTLIDELLVAQRPTTAEYIAVDSDHRLERNEEKVAVIGVQQ
jgi:hypothetical protein